MTCQNTRRSMAWLIWTKLHHVDCGLRRKIEKKQQPSNPVLDIANKAWDTILGHNLTKDSILLLHAIHSPFYWRILKKPCSSLILKILTKIHETRKLESFHEWHFVEPKFLGENPTKTRVWEDSSLCPETLHKKPFKNYISAHVHFFIIFAVFANSQRSRLRKFRNIRQ